MEIKDNKFSRQFETSVENEILSVEYSFQEKKIFLSKIKQPEGFDNEDLLNEFLKEIMTIIYQNKWKMVPIFPRVALFVRKNPTYKDLLPPGIKI